jgi:hypothetical protein
MERWVGPWKEPKVRRLFRKPFNNIFHRQRYFVSRYLGADFLLQPSGIGTLEITAKISERPELNYLIARCAEFGPELLIDVGANIGMYEYYCLSQHEALVETPAAGVRSGNGAARAC